jgi:hypothetical protein
VLTYGLAESRRAAVERLLAEADPEVWGLLASTVHSPAPWRLRARCLEALGLAAGRAEQPLAEHILGLLVEEGRQ